MTGHLQLGTIYLNQVSSNTQRGRTLRSYMPDVTYLKAGGKFLWTSRVFVSVFAAVKTVYSHLQNDCPNPQCWYALPPIAGQCHQLTQCSLQGRHCSEPDNAAWLRFAANSLPMHQLPMSPFLFIAVTADWLHYNAVKCS